MSGNNENDSLDNSIMDFEKEFSKKSQNMTIYNEKNSSDQSKYKQFPNDIFHTRRNPLDLQNSLKESAFPEYDPRPAWMKSSIIKSAANNVLNDSTSNVLKDNIEIVRNDLQRKYGTGVNYTKKFNKFVESIKAAGNYDLVESELRNSSLSPSKSRPIKKLNKSSLSKSDTKSSLISSKNSNSKNSFIFSTKASPRITTTDNKISLNDVFKNESSYFYNSKFKKITEMDDDNFLRENK